MKHSEMNQPNTELRTNLQNILRMWWQKLADNDKRWRNNHHQVWSANVCHLPKRTETVRDIELDNPSTVLGVIF